MATPATKRTRFTPRTATLLVGLGLMAALVAFLAGQWSAGPAASPRSAAAAAPRGPARAVVPPWTPRPVETESLATAAARAQAPTTSVGRATPELVAQATAQTTNVLESARSELVSRCWPRAGLASGHPRTTVTFNVTFDAGGREIARAIGGDRFARAPEVIACLQRMPLGSLRIPPPGANVGVKVAMQLP